MTDPDQYPGAQYRPLASGEPSAITGPHSVCLHTMCGYLDGTDSYFKQNGWSGTESHFGVGGQYDKSGQDGMVYQWVRCDRRADANLDGNWHIVSIETSDGARSPVPAWTAKQVESIASILAWCHTRYGIPLEKIPDSKPERRGVCYHRQGIDNWRVSGGEYWSSSTGKVCPSDARVAQVDQVINRARELVGQPIQPPSSSPPPSGGSGGGGDTFSLSFDGGGSMSLRYLKEGVSGGDVRAWQGVCNQKFGAKISEDGDFGPATKTATTNAQKSLGVTADAVVGPTTLERAWER